ncbi:MAG TPA: protein translocase subunit SecD [Thermoanaerobaculia bacterium]|nr:protein translocase subunit SecD [Thermoanaerobaculia bacterium]
MNKNQLWKIILIIAVLAVFTYALLPIGDREPIRLGLDLKGGTHLVMQVNTGDAIRTEVDQAMERLKGQAGQQNLPTPALTRNTEQSFVLTVPDGVPTDGYEKLIADWLPDYDVSAREKGLEVRLPSAAVGVIADQTVSQALETINNRIDALGVAEHIAVRQGARRIVIQLPGVDDPARVKEIIRTTAQLQFRLVEAGPSSTSQAAMASIPAGVSREEVEVLPGNSYDEFRRVTGQQYYVMQRSVPVTGRDLKTARVQQGQLGEPVVGFSLTPEGSRKFSQLTGANVGRQLAIVLDDRVQSAPVIRSEISDEGVIEGSFTPQEATDLALVLRSGSLPASLSTLEERTVGPSLGLDSIRSGVSASAVGFVLMLITVTVYYRGAGVNASIALLLNLVIVVGMMALVGATLTLPGIAGIILTLAMAIDSNVLVFERIREELRAGKSVRAAINQGFSLAFGTVIDTNLTTMIAALFLFQFGSGPVRGFAVTLLIGLAASVFTAFFVSRVLFDLIYNRAGARPESISI